MSASHPVVDPQHEIVSPPRRFIFNDVDMEAFMESPAKKELLRLVQAMGKSCAVATSFEYDPTAPLLGLNPPMASLHGSLRYMKDHWLIAKDPNVQGRFGNPIFRKWHDQLMQRSGSIIRCVLQCHQHFPRHEETYEMSVLEEASNRGYQAAAPDATYTESLSTEDQQVVTELSTYLHDSFGHPMRLDYGTGHESSFMVLLFSLCKLGCFGGTGQEPPSAPRLKAICIALFSQYLEVTRQVQTEYMLEPAGSHGVWGLDDYQCLPFYFGACQLIPHEVDIRPSAVQKDSLVAQNGDEFLYFGCIRYIRQLKKSAPFFESSPMLYDISHMPNWTKVSTGLLRLFEGEVLHKRQVVQHFCFGQIFKATWTPSSQPSASQEHNLPTLFRDPVPAHTLTRAPWATEAGEHHGAAAAAGHDMFSPTRAPWASEEDF